MHRDFLKGAGKGVMETLLLKIVHIKVVRPLRRARTSFSGQGSQDVDKNSEIWQISSFPSLFILFKKTSTHTHTSTTRAKYGPQVGGSLAGRGFLEESPSFFPRVEHMLCRLSTNVRVSWRKVREAQKVGPYQNAPIAGLLSITVSYV